MRKLITVDLDGTLLTAFKKIPEKNIKSLKKAQEMGHIVMVATGRPHKDCVDIARKLDIHKYSGLVASNNGALITDIKNNKVVSNTLFDLELLKKILKYIEEMKMPYNIRENGKVYTNFYSKFLFNIFWRINRYKIVENRDFYEKIDFQTNKILVNGKKEKLREVMQKLQGEFGDDIYVCFSSSFSIEIMPKGAHKGYAVRTAAKMFDIDIKDTISFGNAGNDIAMFENSGVSVAVANSSKELLEIADYITLSNKEAGVSDYLEKYILNEEIK